MPCKGQTVDDLVTRVSTLLGDNTADCSFTRWSKSFLIDTLNEALCALSGLRPDAFTELTDITLQPGTLQHLSDDFSALVDIKTSSSKANPLKVSSVAKGDEYFTSVLRGKKCLTNEDCPSAPQSEYVVSSYATHASDDKTFSVQPPVPVGTTQKVKAIVVRAPGKYCPTDGRKDVDVDCKFISAVIEFMLYRAYSIEIDSQYSDAVAQQHLQSYFRLIDKGYMYDSRRGSGYFKGAVGDGDPKAGSYPR